MERTQELGTMLAWGWGGASRRGAAGKAEVKVQADVP